MGLARSWPRAKALCGKMALCLSFMLALPAFSDEQLESNIEQLLAGAQKSVQLKDVEAALDQYQHAQHLIHREDGVLSARQIPILEMMALIHLEQGSFANANRMMELQHRIVGEVSNHSAESMAPSWQTIGQWYQRTLQPRKSQKAFKQALSIIEQYGLPRSELSSIKLAMLKNEYLLASCCDMEEAISGFDAYELSAQQLLELGDLSLLAGDSKTARRFYRRSNITLPASPIGVARIDHLARTYVEAVLDRRSRMSIVTSAEMTPTRLVGTPVAVCESRIADVSGRHDYTEFSINLAFVVTDKGKLRKLKMLDSSAPTAVNALFRKQLQSIRFRPELINGLPQNARVVINQQFDQLALQGPAEQRAGTQLGCVAAARTLEQSALFADLR